MMMFFICFILCVSSLCLCSWLSISVWSDPVSIKKCRNDRDIYVYSTRFLTKKNNLTESDLIVFGGKNIKYAKK